VHATATAKWIQFAISVSYCKTLQYINAIHAAANADAIGNQETK
jgi:hypothetical protein